MNLKHKLVFVIVLLLVSARPSAYILTDTLRFDRALVSGETYSFTHDFTDDGFVAGSDKIVSATARFGFAEIVEGDSVYQENEGIPADWEFLIMYSRIFDGRLVIANVDTGFLTQSVNGYLEEFSQTGSTVTSIASFTDNLWLGDIIMEIEVARAGAPVPEPSALMLLGLSLSAFGLIRGRKARNTGVFRTNMKNI